MLSHTPGDARMELLSLLDDMIRCATQMKQSLEAERDALASQDLGRIETTTDEKNACVATLQELDAGRARLCSACGFANGPDQMQQFIAWCDDNAIISGRWDQLAGLVAASRALNMTNGAIIRLRQHQFDTSLAVLRGVSLDANTYGRHGAASRGFNHQTLAEV